MNTLRCSWLIYLAMRVYVNRILIVVGAVCIPLLLAQARPHPAGVMVLVGLLGIVPVFLSIYTFYTWDKVPQLFMVMPQRRVDFVRALYVNYLVLSAADVALGVAAALFLPGQMSGYLAICFPLACSCPRWSSWSPSPFLWRSASVSPRFKSVFWF